MQDISRLLVFTETLILYRTNTYRWEYIPRPTYIAEKIDWALNVDKQLANLTNQQQEAILAVIEGDKYEPPVKRRRTVKKMKSSIFNYVKKKVLLCGFRPMGRSCPGQITESLSIQFQCCLK